MGVRGALEVDFFGWFPGRIQLGRLGHRTTRWAGALMSPFTAANRELLSRQKLLVARDSALGSNIF